jgi:hypothetical protein
VGDPASDVFTADNGVDDDGNGFIDDINGWDFAGGCSTGGWWGGAGGPAYLVPVMGVWQWGSLVTGYCVAERCCMERVGSAGANDCPGVTTHGADQREADLS